MTIIAFSNIKGGVGKSSTAVHLIYWLSQLKKKRVAVIDADAQGSTSTWLEVLELNLPIHRITDPDLLAEEPIKLGKEYDFVVIDNAANSSESSRCTMQVADLVVVPVTPSGLDLLALSQQGRMIKQMQLLRSGLPTAAIFLNRAVKNTRLLKEGIEAIKQLEGIKPMQSVIYNRQCLADALLSKTVAWEMKDKESAREYQQLFNELMRLIK